MTRTKQIIWWSGLIGSGAVVAVIGFMIGRWIAPAPDPSGSAADAGVSEPSAAQTYTCPMHPSVRTNNPSDLCPICGMELVPLEDDGDADADGDLPRLRISHRAAALMRVQTVPARRAAAERDVQLYGRVTIDERRAETITAWASGRVESLHVDFTGQRIVRDQPMLDLYSPQLITAQQELLAALHGQERSGNDDANAMRMTRQDVNAARDRLRLLGVSESLITEIESTGQVRDVVTITAPRGGVVTERVISEGAYVDVGETLFTIADLSQVWVTFDAFESDLPWLREGQSATFTTQALPGRTFEGVVTFIDPVFNDNTRSVRARLDVANADRALRPGMFVDGAMHAALTAEGHAIVPDGLEAGGNTDDLPLVIPASAPLLTGERAVVYVQVDDTDRPTFEARDVRLGPRAGDTYVVLDGIDEGELVVVNGQFRIDSELQIRGRQSMMQPMRPDETPVAHDTIITDDHAARAIEPTDVPDGFADELAEVLGYYLAMADALSLDDGDAAASALEHLHELLYQLDVEPLPAEVREAWAALDQAYHGVIHDLPASPDIDALRSVLEPLTELMAVTVAHFIGDRAGTVYRAHCPMVDDFRGADWLQRSRDIANPYFGSQMFRCGEIVGEVAKTNQDDVEAPAQDDAAAIEHDVPDDPDPDESAAVTFPDDFARAVIDALDAADEIATAIERDHADHARHAVSAMQAALFALDLASLDQVAMDAWLEVDVEINDALRNLTEAESIEAMRDHVPHLRQSVRRARDVLAASADTREGEGGST